MANLGTQAIILPSTVPTWAAAAAAGDTGTTGPNTNLVVRNMNAATRTVTVVVPGNVWNGVAAPDTAVTVPAAAAGIPGIVFIPLDARYNDPADSRAHWTYSTEVDLTVAVISH